MDINAHQYCVLLIQYEQFKVEFKCDQLFWHGKECGSVI